MWGGAGRDLAEATHGSVHFVSFVLKSIKFRYNFREVFWSLGLHGHCNRTHMGCHWKREVLLLSALSAYPAMMIHGTSSQETNSFFLLPIEIWAGSDPALSHGHGKPSASEAEMSGRASSGTGGWKKGICSFGSSSDLRQVKLAM